MSTKTKTEPKEGTMQADVLALFRKGSEVPIEKVMQATNRNRKQARGFFPLLKRRGWTIVRCAPGRWKLKS